MALWAGKGPFLPVRPDDVYAGGYGNKDGKTCEGAQLSKEQILTRRGLAVVEKHADALSVVHASDGLVVLSVSKLTVKEVDQPTSAKTLPTSSTSSLEHRRLWSV